MVKHISNSYRNYLQSVRGRIFPKVFILFYVVYISVSVYVFKIMC